MYPLYDLLNIVIVIIVGNYDTCAKTMDGITLFYQNLCWC